MAKKEKTEETKKEKGKLLKEFKEFISRGNVIDLAVGVVIGSAFTAIVDSLVNDIVMPLVGWLIGGIDFSSFKLTLPGWEIPDPLGDGAMMTTDGASILYGSFINSVINFLLLAIVVFLLVKGINSFRRKKEEPAPAPAEPSDEVKLLTEIRDLMAEKDGGKKK